MTAAHTPGPWTYDFSTSSDGGPEFMILAPGTAVVALVWPDEEKNVDGATVEANARLIAAAPEMFRLLSHERVNTKADLAQWTKDVMAVLEQIRFGRVHV